MNIQLKAPGSRATLLLPRADQFSLEILHWQVLLLRRSVYSQSTCKWKFSAHFWSNSTGKLVIHCSDCVDHASTTKATWESRSSPINSGFPLLLCQNAYRKSCIRSGNSEFIVGDEERPKEEELQLSKAVGSECSSCGGRNKVRVSSLRAWFSCRNLPCQVQLLKTFKIF